MRPPVKQRADQIEINPVLMVAITIGTNRNKSRLPEYFFGLLELLFHISIIQHQSRGEILIK